jgi:hypothetical protein
MTATTQRAGPSCFYVRHDGKIVCQLEKNILPLTTLAHAGEDVSSLSSEGMCSDAKSDYENTYNNRSSHDDNYDGK